MKYAIDSEFIDTPKCSALISFAIVAEDGGHRYFEFDYPAQELTPWLKNNVIPFLGDHGVCCGVAGQRRAAEDIRRFIGNDKPEFWAYYGSYDWYFFCRLFGGFMQMPKHWPQIYWDAAHLVKTIPTVTGHEHHALDDARNLMACMKAKRYSNNVRPL